MSYDDLELLCVRVDRRVAFVTIDHPPINLFDRPLMLEFHHVAKLLAADPEVAVVVVESANPDFFIAHADITAIQALVTEDRLDDSRTSFFQALVERFRTMPKVTIAKVEGRARGGGSELALSMDMIFAARERAIFSQPEVMLGLLPGGSGTQRLPRRMGRARALEVILGCEDFPAELAERYGYINRALDANELGPFVERLAYRMAGFPPEVVALAKRAVDAADPGIEAALLQENRLFNEAVQTSAATRRMARFLELGGQTAEVERDDLITLAEALANS